MLKLVKLELKKSKLGWYVNGAIIANVIMAALLCLIGYVESNEGHAAFNGFPEAFVVIGAIVRATFIVFAAVLIAKLVIEEYKNKTITIMFSYPISRKKIIASKLWIVGGLTFITIVISNVFVAIVFFSVNAYLQFIPGSLTLEMVVQQVVSMFAFAFAAAGTSLIPLYFGMRKLSVPETILSSILITATVSAHNPVFSLASIIYIPLSLAVVGLVLAAVTIRRVEQVDVS
ncbi:ABC transporter permease [Paenibacillus profundus]|uniref:ABC transporter permease n=1 Tax=Paenibacillus profundus TaxID=1173085 RepID=A0ABS8YH81_9BACL|nr:ABC transporter permease [Paenibacillus profundus]MCE5168864.1 ABC transporter permease [Paenibacillus profundus]